MTRTQELIDLMKKLGFNNNSEELEDLNEEWKKEDIEEY